MIKRTSRLALPILPLCFLVAASILTTTASLHGRLQFVRSTAHTLAAPLHSLRARTASTLAAAWQQYVDVVNVRQENLTLKRELERLKAEEARLTEDNLRLRRLALLADAPIPGQDRCVPAEVIARDASNWSRTVLLNKGSAKGVRQNDVVMSSAGLVGRVIDLSPRTARVLLITDPRSSVDCLVQRNRAGGIVVGATDNTCRVKYLSTTHDVRVGDRIISSGLGGVFPKGLLVGTVVMVSKDTTRPFQRVTILPATDLERLEEALIVSEP
jgi:rod shape-determining protein MreC